ncbi:MAG: hypothetical protein A2Y12_00190 [Planctomycetes bacterium GWF2_42_9]|nr:MAG: hypothetical protein A2Y12_00190 [Planctomycetes bacterium GWF2_42_9]
MKKEEIEINGLYTMKVGKNTTAVRIMSQNADGHWVACNIKTNKEILIKSENQLTGVYKAESEDGAMDTTKTHTSPHTPSQVETETEGSSTTAKPKKKRTGSQTGGLTAALLVLEEEGKPLNCQEMVKLMIERGYWNTIGKTPASTIYSAIITEIKKKGDDSRFRKTERGKFELAAK